MSGKKLLFGLVILVILAFCVNAVTKEEAVKDSSSDESWTDWAKERIGLKNEDNSATETASNAAKRNKEKIDETVDSAKGGNTKETIEEKVGEVKKKAEENYEAAKTKAGESFESVKETVSDKTGKVRDDVEHKSKKVKDSLVSDDDEEPSSDWAKEKVGLKNEEDRTVGEKAENAEEAVTRKGEETVGAVKEKASEMAGAGKEKAEESYESVKDKSNKVKCGRVRKEEDEAEL